MYAGPEESIEQVDRRISMLEYRLALSPPSNPTLHVGFMILAGARGRRYTLSQDKEDIEKSILHYAKGILLPFPPSDRPHMAYALFGLATALILRSKHLGQLEDIKFSVQYFRYLRSSHIRIPNLTHETLSQVLVAALADQVKLEAGTATPNIGEMVVLCHELLAEDALIGSSRSTVAALTMAVWEEHCRGEHVEPLDQVVEYLREVRKVRSPGLDQEYLDVELGKALYIRFNQSLTNEDRQEAMALFDGVIASHLPGHTQNSYVSEAAMYAMILAMQRYALGQDPADLEDAISRCRTWFTYASGDALYFRRDVAQFLGHLMKMRFDYFGLTEGLQEVHSTTLDFFSLSSPLGSDMPKETLAGWLCPPAVRAASCTMTELEEKLQHLRELLPKTPPGTLDHNNRLDALVYWCQAKSRGGIKHCQAVLTSTSRNFMPRPFYSVWLIDALFTAFERSHRIEYLEESISLNLSLLKMKGMRQIRFGLLQRHIVFLFDWQMILGSIQGWEEILVVFPLGVDDEYTSLPDRLKWAGGWASLARASGHPSVLPAYKSAMSLMQGSLVFAPTLGTQHTQLAARAGIEGLIPSDYVSYLVQIGQLEQAIEALEQGRALLWSELRGFRTSVDRLRKADPTLAEKFSTISRELETLTTSTLPSGKGGMYEGEGQDQEGVDAVGRTVKKHKKLLETRDALISQIQQLPGFEGSFRAPSFSTIRAAASHGPVIILNHCRWRSDVLILLHDAPPSLVPTVDDLYGRANEWRDQLLDTRNEFSLDSKKYQRALRSILESLFEYVGRPVIDRLRELKIPEQSRVWWCPTSVFCSLPLHAMGPIPSENNSKLYFSDLYISSYTPTLSALVEARAPSRWTTDNPSLLVVAQPDASLPGVRGEMGVIKKLLGESAHCLVLRNATAATVAENLGSHPLAHFACHGNLETGKPFEASFKLFGDDRLTLLDIVRSRLPTAEFAFLSACHTAELTDQSAADEALHLTAAMQYCGFRSVVGTMWAMADTDGRDLVGHFYKTMFSSSSDGDLDRLPHHRRSAKALRDAKGMTLERWVNFVHYGA
ncbi:CHAT domain-containing protein [Russula compacta]|nr:CHAT domain-containing protein [Russula compacta]